jgi:hypothetical protein
MHMTHHMSMSAQQRTNAAGPELDASLRALQQAPSHHASASSRVRNGVSRKDLRRRRRRRRRKETRRRR